MKNKALSECSFSESSNLWTIAAKLAGIASLFRNIQTTSFSSSELYGISLLLEDLVIEIKTFEDANEI